MKLKKRKVESKGVKPDWIGPPSPFIAGGRQHDMLIGPCECGGYHFWCDWEINFRRAK